jgi:hypothetical protein
MQANSVVAPPPVASVVVSGDERTASDPAISWEQLFWRRKRVARLYVKAPSSPTVWRLRFTIFFCFFRPDLTLLPAIADVHAPAAHYMVSHDCG